VGEFKKERDDTNQSNDKANATVTRSTNTQNNAAARKHEPYAQKRALRANLDLGEVVNPGVAGIHRQNFWSESKERMKKKRKQIALLKRKKQDDQRAKKGCGVQDVSG